MTRAMQLSLRAGEKIFVNGAVLQADRRVNIKLLNDATFLLESHVMQASETTTPLRQLYFVVQSIIIEPRDADQATTLFWDMHVVLTKLFQNEGVLAALDRIGACVAAGRAFEALRAIRALFPIEDGLLGARERAVPPAA
jgi:flagellar protein FlbT